MASCFGLYEVMHQSHACGNLVEERVLATSVLKQCSQEADGKFDSDVFVSLLGMRCQPSSPQQNMTGGCV